MSEAGTFTRSPTPPTVTSTQSSPTVESVPESEVIIGSVYEHEIGRLSSVDVA